MMKHSTIINVYMHFMKYLKFCHIYLLFLTPIYTFIACYQPNLIFNLIYDDIICFLDIYISRKHL